MLQSELYNSVITEHFDITDNVTRKTLVYVNEADKSQVLAALANKLYGKIVKNVAEIDFGTIPLTKGDITKMEGYQDMIETLDIIRELLVYHNQPTKDVDTVLATVENMKKLQRVWEKAYAIDCGLVVILYNTTCLAIMNTTSLLIASVIEYIKEPGETNFDTTVQKVSKNKTAEALMLRNLEKFNDACKKGEIEKTCKELCEKNYAAKQEAALLESEQCLTESPVPAVIAAMGTSIPATIVSVASLLAVISLIIPFLRELTVTFYNAKQSVSDYLAMEADVVRLNAEHVQYKTTKTPEKREKIKTKQLKIADRLKKMSDKLTIKMTKAAKEAENEVKKDKFEKVKIDDVVDTLPDSVSSLF